MTRERRFALYLTLAIVGGIGIGLSTWLVIEPGYKGAIDTARIVIGTLIVALAMAWAFFFATRAHFARDEFKRQREISASFWGGWMGIAASTPISFCILMIVGLRRLPLHVPPMWIFETGYLLPILCAVIGTIGARQWLRHRDR